VLRAREAYLVREVRPIYIIGDVHGYVDVLLRLLREVGLVDDQDDWAGAAATLWLLGDFVDQGPRGADALDLVMRLQAQAAEAGGALGALVGNHDLLLLAARRFGDRAIPGYDDFLAHWRANGGQQADLELLTPAHVRWLSGLPALARCGDWLLAHADATFYADYGASVEEVNAALRAVLTGEDVAAWVSLSVSFSRHREFVGAPGAARLSALLRRFGAAHLIHGHTPIVKHPASHPRGDPAPRPETVTGPLIYADGRCVDVDGGIYLGGPGFVYRLPPDPASRPSA
jgi:hypothetical protein